MRFIIAFALVPLVVLSLFILDGLLRFIGGVLNGIKQGRVDQRRAANQCVKCGYSMTGNISGVCPECGRVVQRK